MRFKKIWGIRNGEACGDIDSPRHKKITLEVVANNKVVALLSSETQDNGREVFTLQYTQDFENERMASFHMRLKDKPIIGEVYKSDVLWHAFARRVPNPKRPDFKEACVRAGLNGNEHVLELLGKMSSTSIANSWKLRIAK